MGELSLQHVNVFFGEITAEPTEGGCPAYNLIRLS